VKSTIVAIVIARILDVVRLIPRDRSTVGRFALSIGRRAA